MTVFSFAPGVTIFRRDIPQNRDVWHGLHQKIPWLRTRLLKRPELLGPGHHKAAKLSIPFVLGRSADTVPAARSRRRRTSLLLLQYPGDLFIAETAPLHSSILCWSRLYGKMAPFWGRTSSALFRTLGR